ncbi:MAG: hypothetical protein L3J31_09030 [Bacteroidales bacterium]|nr:hypothetical protein [Bacteroidales bacterium]
MAATDKPGFISGTSGKLIMRLSGLFVFLFLSIVLPAQTFEDFKKQVRQEYDDFEQSTRKKFDNFIEKIDKEFTTYLADNFAVYPTEKSRRLADDGKPVSIPKAAVKSPDVPVEMIAYSEPDKDFSIRQGPMLPNIKKTETIDFETDSVNVSFLGWPLYFTADKKLKTTAPESIDARGISNYWAELSASNYNHLLYQLSNVKDILNLNDWGYYQLVKGFTGELTPDKNRQVLLQWVLLSRSRYKVKVAFADEKVYLLLPTIYPLYATDFLHFDGLEYYVMDGKAKDLSTYAVDFPEADIIMDLRISKPFNTEPTTKNIKTFRFQYEGKKHSVKLEFDPNMIAFYKTIPLTDVRVYFNSVVGEVTKNSVIDAFTPLIKGKSPVDAADLLLKFVQQAFDYKTDQQAFGHERYFFVDELLSYPYSDCEDRSVFYAYLVKTLLKTEVLGIGFPGHMATAIHFDDNPEGYFLTYKNKDYVVADPTFFDASIGMLMPLARGENAELIVTEAREENSALAAGLWDIVRKGGGSKAGLLEDVVFDNEGNAYLCGYFTKEVQLGDFSIRTNYPGRDVFVAKFNDNYELLWLNKATGPGNDLAFSLTLRKDGSIYLYGSVEGELSFGGSSLEAKGAPDVFVAKYSTDGQLQWVQKAGIDKLDHSADFMFAAKFNGEGQKIMAKLYSESENFSHYGLSLDDQENALITGSFYATPGMNSNDFKQYDELTNLNKVEALKAANDELLQLKYEQTIAGLFAALNLIKYNNFELKGTQVQKAFDDYNPGFAQQAGEFYQNFGEMNFLKNKGGIIVIKTRTGEPLHFNMLRVDNEARIKIIKYKSGNVAVQVFSGISVGNRLKSYALNSIKLFKDTGDVLFDYGDDNSTKKLNLKKEILKR